MRTALTLACLACVPATATGQAVLAGAVADPSGAAMPGVAVAISSPVLIRRTAA